MQRGGLPVVVLMVPDERKPARPFLQMLSYMSAGSYVYTLAFISPQGFFFLPICQIEGALDNESSRTLFGLTFFFLFLISTKSLVVRLLGCRCDLNEQNLK